MTDIVGITGCSGGIGQALQTWLENRNVKVLAFVRNPGPLEYPLDVTWPAHSIVEVMRLAAEHIGAFNGWINLAGADILREPLRSLPYEERLMQLWQTDVLGSIRCCRAVLPFLAEDSCVVNVGWDEIWTGHRGSAGELYATAKAAVTAYSLSWAQSAGPNRRVFVAAPGWVKTRWADTLSQAQLSRTARKIPGGAWQSARMVAQAIGQLVMERASIPTGTIRRIGETS